MAVGQLTLRSVDSEWAGRVIEPRNLWGIAGVDVVQMAEDNTESAAVAERKGPAGVEEQGTCILGFSRNLGGPVVSVSESGLGIPVNNSRPAAVASCGCGNEAQGAATVPWREGNGATRKGRQEGGVLRSTDEVGEPARGTLRREGSTGTRARSGERWRRHRAPEPYQRNSSK